MHLAPLIQDLAVILITAAAVAFVFHALRQPVIMGYILAGALVGPRTFLPSPVTDLPNIRVWAELGVVFLMFHLGLEFSFRRFQRLGGSLVAVGFLEVGTMFAICWLVGMALGFRGTSALFFAGILAISSTTIIVKALDDAGLRSRRFSERVFGVLIVEDLIAVLLIVILGSASAGKEIVGSHLMFLSLELVVVIGGWYLIGGLIVPRFLSRVGRSRNEELLTVLSIGLCLLLAVAAARFHYSMALGAFIMGSIIAESPEADRIQRLIHPLKDVFAAVFFVSVGMLADLSALTEDWGRVLGLSLLVITGKFVSVASSSLLAGIGFRSSLRMGLSMGQIGEFSFIIAGLGIASGRLTSQFQSLIVSVSLLTAFTTPYLIRSSEPVANLLETILPDGFFRKLERHTARLNSLKDGRILPHWLRPGLGRLLVNALLVALIFGSVRRYVQPLLEQTITNPLIAPSAGFLTAIACSAPFIYGMLTAARRTGRNEDGLTVEPANQAAARAFVFILFSLLWLGVLSAQYVSAAAIATVTVTLSIIVIGFFFRRLGHSYQWLEGRFLSGLQSQQPESDTQRAMRDLAPWDAHLVRLIVHPNAPAAGLSLSAASLRQNHGLMVIAIGRGERVVAMPEGSQLLLPYDELLVLGLDEQIDLARDEIERPSHGFGAQARTSLTDYDMRALKLTNDSPLCGLTVKDSGLRERYGALIVGLEKSGRRILSPSPELRLEAGDLIWVVGTRDAIQAL